MAELSDAPTGVQLGGITAATLRSRVEAGILDLIGNTSARIPPSDQVGRRREWRRAADHWLDAADDCLSEDDIDGAAIGFLRAAVLYRKALLESEPESEDDRTGHLGDRAAHVSAFRAAVPLLPFDGHVIEFQRGGITVSGYVFRASTESCGVLLQEVAAGSTAEITALDLIEPTLARGWDYLVVQAHRIQPVAGRPELTLDERTEVRQWLMVEGRRPSEPGVDEALGVGPPDPLPTRPDLFVDAGRNGSQQSVQ